MDLTRNEAFSLLGFGNPPAVVLAIPSSSGLTAADLLQNMYSFAGDVTAPAAPAPEPVPAPDHLGGSVPWSQIPLPRRYVTARFRGALPVPQMRGTFAVQQIVELRIAGALALPTLQMRAIARTADEWELDEIRLLLGAYFRQLTGHPVEIILQEKPHA